MRRTHVRPPRRTAVVAALVVAVLAAGRAAGGADGPRTSPGPPAQRHVVQAGDTLWDIARSRLGPEADPRPLVEAIRRANDIGPGELTPGVELTVPDPATL